MDHNTIQRNEREADQLRSLWFVLSELDLDYLARATKEPLVAGDHPVGSALWRLKLIDFTHLHSRLVRATELGRRVHVIPYSRVDLFKESGKWYASGYVDMRLFAHHTVINDGVLSACKLAHEQLNDSSWPVVTSPDEWLEHNGSIVCIEPFHINSHPVSLRRHHFVKLPKGEAEFTLRVIPPEGESF